ncbi:MAG TPA: hypothetical protein VKR82_06000 [Candidatus Acidoferrales bacterium]|nr:hypothetical protein [Candidatus Acidoferrales bacterium]
MAATDSPGKSRRRPWAYLIFIAVNICFWYSTKYWFYPEVSRTDRQKWEVRPRLDLASVPHPNLQMGESDLAPCLYVVPPTGLKQPVVSGTVGDCILLIPDGSQWDLFEVRLDAGYFFPVTTDVFVAGTMPLAFTRTYLDLDAWSYRTKIYLRDVYDPYLTGKRNPYTLSFWTLPDGVSFEYKRISLGTGYAEAVFECGDAGHVFGGSRIAWNGWGWDVSLADGTTYLSPEAYSVTRPSQGSIVGIFDRDGNEVRLTRERNGNLVKIESPGGGWIRISYSDYRIISVEGSSGDKVHYEYDRFNRLRQTTNSQGITREYAYDDYNRMLKVVDSKAGPILQVRYDSEGKTVEATLADGTSYYLNYKLDDRGDILQVDVNGPQSDVTHVRIFGDRYAVQKLPQRKSH